VISTQGDILTAGHRQAGRSGAGLAAMGRTSRRGGWRLAARR
jgi:hypothetical protein